MAGENAVGDHRLGCLRSRDEGGRLGVRTSRRKRETAFALATQEESYSAFFLRRSDRGSDGKTARECQHRGDPGGSVCARQGARPRDDFGVTSSLAALAAITSLFR